MKPGPFLRSTKNSIENVKEPLSLTIIIKDSLKPLKHIDIVKTQSWLEKHLNEIRRWMKDS